MKEVWVKDVLLAFDGRVVEVFGFPGSESIRFHVRNLELTVDEPDRKGRRAVTLKPAMRGGGCRLEVPEADWPEAEPLLEEILAAIPDQQGG